MGKGNMITITQNQLADILMEAIEKASNHNLMLFADDKTTLIDRLMERAGMETLQNEINYGKE